MPFVFPEKTKVSNREGKSRDELFVMFMIEIGQYRELPTGGVELVGEYMKQSEITREFNSWLKKES